VGNKYETNGSTCNFTRDNNTPRDPLQAFLISQYRYKQKSRIRGARNQLMLVRHPN